MSYELHWKQHYGAAHIEPIRAKSFNDLHKILLDTFSDVSIEMSSDDSPIMVSVMNGFLKGVAMEVNP